jgi:hypothetical protein
MIRDSIFIAFIAAPAIWNVWDRGPWRGVTLAFFVVLLFISHFRRRTRRN